MASDGPGLGVRILAVVTSSMLLAATVAPYYWHGLHWFALLPLFWALRLDGRRSDVWLTVLHGTLTQAFIFVWIAETITLFSNLPAVLAWATLALFSFVYGLSWPLAFGWVPRLRRRLGDGWMLALPALVVVTEWIAAHIWLFPYQQGVSQYRFVYTFQLASVTGIWGLSFVVVFFNTTLGEGIYRLREGRPFPTRWFAAAVAVVVGTVAFSTWRYHAMEAELAEAPVRRVLQVQSDKGMQWRMSHPAGDTFAFWLEATKAHEGEDVDLVVWPEGAVPYQLNASLADGVMWDLAASMDADLLVGAGTREREPDPLDGGVEIRMFNSTYHFEVDRLDVPDDQPGREDEARALAAGGCDLDAAHVWTAAEAHGLARALDDVPEAVACRDALDARRDELATGKASFAFFQQLAGTDAFRALRHQTARFDGPLAEAAWVARRGTSTWRLDDGACTDGDCRSITVRCADGRGCLVHPEAPHYDKMVPLPFGEYLPFAEIFPFLRDWIRGPGNFRAGTEAVIFDVDGARVATPICYEAILAYVCRRWEQPDLFVNVTNDAWFGTGAASDLHGMLAAIRATELGVPVFRSAYAGVSLVAEPHGVIHHETPLFTEVSRVIDVRMGRADTLYARFGDWFVALCAMVLVVLWGTSRPRDAEAPTP